MTGNYALGFAPRARRQITRFLTGSRLREWREETVARMNEALKDEPMRFGEGRATDTTRVWFHDGLRTTYRVDESAKRVTVLDVRVVR